jgi:hypothetical protein
MKEIHMIEEVKEVRKEFLNMIEEVKEVRKEFLNMKEGNVMSMKELSLVQ